MIMDKKEAEKNLRNIINAKKGTIPVGSVKGVPSKKSTSAKQKIVLEKVKTQMLGIALIVEPNKRVALLLQNMLKTIRFKAVIASNGAEAIRFIKTYKARIIYIDKDLPDISGFNLCTKLRIEKNGQGVPIIITSESADPSMHDQAIMVDANDHLAKPINMAKLKATIVDHIIKPAQKNKE